MTSRFINSAFLMIALTTLIVVSAVRIHRLAVPLERDEGEYAYAGQLLLEGIPPFAQACNMKLPGIYAAYAAVLFAFGQTSAGIHAALLIINLLCSTALFFIGRQLFNTVVGCAAAIAFSVLSLSSTVLGFSANAEQYVLLFSLAGIAVLLKSLVNGNKYLILLSGFLMGSGFLMKQHGALFVLFGIVIITRNGVDAGLSVWKKHFRFLSLFCAGAIFPFGLMCLWLWGSGVFNQFWFWTFTYARSYVSQVSFSNGLINFTSTFNRICSFSPLFWFLAFWGLISLLIDRTSQHRTFLVLCYIVLSFAAVCPGFYFREHYFVLLLPAVSLLCGIGIQAFFSVFAKKKLFMRGRFYISIFITTAAVIITLWNDRRLLFQLSPVAFSRAIYGANPFPESVVIADSLARWTAPGEKIAIIGSEPQIYFYSHRRSASGFMYVYPLMEKHPFALEMQRRMMRELETAAPRYFVFVNIPTSWLIQPDSYTEILGWFYRMQKDSLRMVGVADLISSDKTVYRWGDDAKRYRPVSEYWIAVFKRGKTG